MRQDHQARQWESGSRSGDDSELSAADLIGRAVAALQVERTRSFDDAAVALAQRCADAVGRQQVAASLRTQLADATSSAWERGWQPADIHRMASRHVGAAEQALILDVVSDELDRYASATVDPRWAAQLADLEARVWWPPRQTWLDAHRDRGVDWLTLLSRALVALHLLLTLPTIERLTPLPGTVPPPEARDRDKDRGGRPDASTAGTGSGVDARILTRVRMLLAKAESTTFEAEAETFTAGAQALMARHSIDAALLAADGRRERGGEGRPQGRRVGIETPYDGPKAVLLDAVATANRCRMVWSRELGFGTVMGFEADLDAVEVIFTSLLVQANARLMAEGKRVDQRGRSRTRSFRHSFLTAYAHRIGERLAEVTAAEVESATVAATDRGQELVPLLAARAEEVDDVVQTWFPVVKRSAVGSVRDPEGWHVGREAADRARLDGGSTRPAVGRRG